MGILSRRNLLLLTSAACLVGNLTGQKGWISPVLANQSGDNDSGKEGNDIIGLKKPVMVSPNRLIDMSPSDLSRYAGRAFNRPGDYKRPNVIVGFSPYMSNWLWSGMYSRPRIFRRLLRKLKNVTDKKKRQQILNEAKRRLESEIRTLNQSIEQMEAKAEKSSGVRLDALRTGIGRDKIRVHDANRALNAVNIWAGSPMEGTLK